MIQILLIISTLCLFNLQIYSYFDIVNKIRLLSYKFVISATALTIFYLFLQLIATLHPCKSKTLIVNVTLTWLRLNINSRNKLDEPLCYLTLH